MDDLAAPATAGRSAAEPPASVTSRLADPIQPAAEAMDVHLTADELAALDAAFPAGAVRGARYPEAYLAGLGR